MQSRTCSSFSEPKPLLAPELVYRCKVTKFLNAKQYFPPIIFHYFRFSLELCSLGSSKNILIHTRPRARPALEIPLSRTLKRRILQSPSKNSSIYKITVFSLCHTYMQIAKSRRHSHADSFIIKTNNNPKLINIGFDKPLDRCKGRDNHRYPQLF